MEFAEPFISTIGYCMALSSKTTPTPIMPHVSEKEDGVMMRSAFYNKYPNLNPKVYHSHGLNLCV